MDFVTFHSLIAWNVYANIVTLRIYSTRMSCYGNGDVREHLYYFWRVEVMFGFAFGMNALYL